jgi:hypothetical protein
VLVAVVEHRGKTEELLAVQVALVVVALVINLVLEYLEQQTLAVAVAVDRVVQHKALEVVVLV